jgi:hypothetical protein
MDYFDRPVRQCDTPFSVQYASGEAPLLACAALFGAETIRRQEIPLLRDEFFTAVRNLGSLCLVIFFLWPTLSTDVMTIRHTTWLAQNEDFVTEEVLRPTALNDFRFDPHGTRWLYSKDYMETLADGVSLTRRHASPDKWLTAFLFTNPYQFALGLHPPVGGTIFWDPVLFQFHNSYPPLQRLIGNATHVLISADDHTLQKAYGTEWTNLRLQKIEETKHFILFKILE